MARWSDLATWRGPTVNQSGAMKAHRGLVVHIAEGYFEGTISWQKNPDANVSSHFIVARDGRIAQMVDTDVTAWTQSAGNGYWLSVENEGFTPNPLTAAQVEANAKLLARGHVVYGYPLQIAVNPDGYGLGHHSMGCNWPAGAWGHCDCPGDAIIAQKQAILDRAIAIVNGDDMSWMDRFPNPGNPGTDAAASEYLVYANNYAFTAATRTAAILTEVTALRSVVEQLAETIRNGGGDVDTAAILAGVDERLAAQRAAIEDDTRDAVADAAEGGAAAARADAA